MANGLGRVRRVAFLILGCMIAAAAATQASGRDLEDYLRISATVGREAAAAAFLRARLGQELPAQTDAAGNLSVAIGSGGPRRLVVCPLGEAGFAVTGIEQDGYLRLGRVGRSMPPATLGAQVLEGHVVMIEGAKGLVPGAVAVHSVHLQERDDASAPPFSLADAWVDVGAENAAEVGELGIRLLDPVSLEHESVRMANGLVAGPSARVKAACLAAAEAARALRPPAGKGTVIFAWTTGDQLSGSGLAYLLRMQGPFAEVIHLDGGFGFAMEDDRLKAAPLPALGSGPLVAGSLAGKLANTQAAPHETPPRRGVATRSRPEELGYLGLPARFLGTPVETVAIADMEKLTTVLLAHLGGSPPASSGQESAAPSQVTQPAVAPSAVADGAHAAAAALLGELVAQYGTSGDEGAVRKSVLAHLPAAVHARVDADGNVEVRLGPAGPGGVLFVAHLDEVGFKVSAVLPDGRLKLAAVGGVMPSLWEAQAALVHGDKGPVAGVFEPRADWLTAERHALSAPPTVDVGVTSAAAASELGIEVGSSVTMPKRLLRLGRHRALARSMDDRVGSTALLLALGRLDARALRHPVIFAWSTREEIGVEGAAALAREFAKGQLPARVHAVDTFVSADSPIESRHFADAPLGHGAVLRGLDNGSYAPRSLVDFALALARQHQIPIQVGQTGGSTDGVPFVADGIAVLPISWPGRYSHSPIEVADFRDLESLIELVVALATADGP